MRVLVLCTDYDGTIARDGVVAESTLAALQRLRASGRRLLLVTGRELPDLQRAMPNLELFDRVVAENGALLYSPSTHEEHPLADPPSPQLVQALRERDVTPLSVGRCIVATWEPHDATVLHAIRDLGLELQVTYNKGAVMVLPSGVNKATGLAAAFEQLGLSARDALGIGDAENDHAFLSWCEYSAAVANALPVLKEAVDIVTHEDHGEGVAELVDELVATDLNERTEVLRKHRVVYAVSEDGRELSIDPRCDALLVAGISGGGKSTMAQGLLERLGERRFSYLVVDPEGDHGTLAGAVTLGTPEQPPTIEEVMQLLAQRENVVLNLLGIGLDDRPAFFVEL
jgi:hydroxymethylpyrimidine pyrophosphatase-like HAD family hydrolase